MPRVLCTRPGASASIGGVRFAPCDEGMLSDDIALELAHELFLECPGFFLYDAAESDPEPATEPEKRGPGRPRKEESPA